MNLQVSRPGTPGHRVAYTLTALGLILALAITAETRVCRADRPQSPGIEIGQSATEFDLPAADGKRYSLAKLLDGHQAVALVFHRSADW